MERDIVIGAVDLYDWSKVRNWVRSIKATNFKGDVILLCYRVDSDLIEHCMEEGVELFGIETNRLGQQLDYNIPGHASDVHQLRFFHIAQTLLTLKKQGRYYRYCCSTDVRDVIFQTNPSEWLESNLKNKKFTIPSENIQFKNENWNKNNVLNSLGPIIYKELEDAIVANVGTIGGDAEYLMHLFFTMHTMTIGLSMPSDQSCFNLLCNGVLKEQGILTDDINGWCAQVGVNNDEAKLYLQPHLLSPKPVIENGYVYTSSKELYCLVHQYDRVPKLNEQINERYK